jgi:hypothetical protein
MKRKHLRRLAMEFGLFCFTTMSISAATITVDITACIDGESQLIIQGNTLQWHNLSFQVPGNAGNCQSAGAFGAATLISTTLNGFPVLTNDAWTPTWPTQSGDVLSSIFSGLSPTVPVSPLSVTLSAIQARSSLTIVQLPTTGNGGVLILDFNDVAPAGSATYEGLLTITTSVPEPNYFALSVMMMIGGILLRWPAPCRWLR